MTGQSVDWPLRRAAWPAAFGSSRLWNLYLKPDTAFDITCRHYFEVFRPITMMLIGHKSDSSKLKRIETHPDREKMRIIWTLG